MLQTVGSEMPASIQIDETGVGTDAPEERGLLKLLPSSRGLLVFVLLLLIFAVSAQPITDPDFWWHLRTGQYIVETKSIPYTDIFSTLRFGSEWVTHEWLSEVFIYSVFRTLGYGGLIAIFSILITVAFWIAYQRCRKRGVHLYVAGFALLLGAAATMPTWGVRPQMFSLLFASIFISFLDRYSGEESASQTTSIWWLVPLMVLWVNLHAGFAMGLTLIGLTIVGAFLDGYLLRKDSLGDIWRRARPLCLVLIICGAAVSLNPSGLRIYSYPFETVTSRAMMQNIIEWRSPDFHEPMFQALSLLIIVTFSVLALSNKRPRPGELLLLGATGWATLRSARNVPFFALVAIPLLAEHSWALIIGHPWGRWFTTPERRALARKPALKIGLNLLLFVLGLTLAALSIQRAVAKQGIVDVTEFPAAAVNFMVAQRPPAPIYNEYIWGGYLIWRLYPDYGVYIDGRADVYGDKLVEEFLEVRDGNPAWRESLDSRGIRTVLVKPEVALASLLRQDSGWEKVFEDKQAVVFVRR